MRLTTSPVCVFAALLVSLPSVAQLTPKPRFGPARIVARANDAIVEKGTYPISADAPVAQRPNSVYTYINGTPLAINAWGDITGYDCFETTQCEEADNEQGSFLFSRGRYITLDFPSTLDAAAPYGINEFGAIVGTYLDASDFTQHGFLKWFGKLVQIDAPAASPQPFFGTFVSAINPQGDILGQYYDSNGANHDFVLRDGKFEDFILPVAGNTYDSPNGINAHGDVVGYYLDSGSAMHGYLLSKGVAYTIDFPGATGTSAQGINSEGEIVGYYTLPLGTATLNSRGFLLKNGVFTTILPPDGSSTFLGMFAVANGINDSGEIAGVYEKALTTESAEPQGFLLSMDHGGPR